MGPSGEKTFAELQQELVADFELLLRGKGEPRFDRMQRLPKLELVTAPPGNDVHAGSLGAITAAIGRGLDPLEGAARDDLAVLLGFDDTSRPLMLTERARLAGRKRKAARRKRVSAKSVREDSHGLFVRLADELLNLDLAYRRVRRTEPGQTGPPARDQSPLYISWATFARLADQLATLLDDYNPTAIFGVARGGLPAAVIVSHRLKVRSFSTIRVWKWERDEPPRQRREAVVVGSLRQLEGLEPREAQVIAVIDDFVDTSETMDAVLDKLTSRLAPSLPRLVQASLLRRGNLPAPEPQWAGAVAAHTIDDGRWSCSPGSGPGTGNATRPPLPTGSTSTAVH